ncbi:hypothetical protein ACFO4L_11360 [Bacillus daqingensis]|uniref:Uncharacterized protein n=1 Tax=Bacillus daqingensis TaxID=872396 RepID=A0ABV9NUX0_9BACI
MLWMIVSMLAFAATVINLYLYVTGKDYTLAMAFGLALTALTLASVQSMIGSWVQHEDWTAL